MHPTPIPETTRARRPRQRRWLAAMVAAAAVAASSCGDSSTDATPSLSVQPSSSDPTSTVPATIVPATTPAATTPAVTTPAIVELDVDAPDLGRVVALAEEPILADLLTLGITPVASSATVEGAGFQGIPDVDLSAVEVLPMTTLSIEYLATLRPDTIVTLQFWVDRVGREALEGMAEVIVVPDGLTGVDRISVLADLVGRPEHAAAAADAHADALAAARERIADDCTVSLAAIYAGPSVAAFVEGIWEIPASIEAMGCTLDPGADDADADQNGRAWLSLEQLGMLDSEWLVLMQSDAVEGESDSVADVEASPLWPTLPAVRAGQVITYDRLGYPGIAGQIRFLDDFSTRFGG